MQKSKCSKDQKELRFSTYFYVNLCRLFLKIGDTFLYYRYLNFKQYNNIKKEKDTYTRYMEYIEKNRSKREREITIQTCIVYSFHYVPLIIIALSIIMIVLLIADVFAFCSPETIEE